MKIYGMTVKSVYDIDAGTAELEPGWNVVSRFNRWSSSANPTQYAPVFWDADSGWVSCKERHAPGASAHSIEAAVPRKWWAQVPSTRRRLKRMGIGKSRKGEAQP